MKKRIVVVTNLYPNEHEKNRGVFIRQLVERLADTFEVSVICPTPWKPNFLVDKSRLIPKQDTINGIKVEYPRHIVIPKMLRFSYGWLMYLALLPVLRKMHQDKAIDLLSAHWVYPDGVGATKVAKKLSLPIVVHALGCDINEYSKYWLRKLQISHALRNSNRIVVKSRDLAYKVENLGASPDNIRTIMNGVDHKKFYPREMEEVRKILDLDPSSKYLLFVGNLQVEKGLIYLLKALPLVSQGDFKLLVIGDGPQAEMMHELVKTLNIGSQVNFLGSIPHEQVPLYLNAVNALSLPSLREGCPNIVLESLSCGTPVIASNVGAVPDMITDKFKGEIVEAMNSAAIAECIPKVMKLKESKNVNFEWASWEDNADSVATVFNELIS